MRLSTHLAGIFLLLPLVLSQRPIAIGPTGDLHIVNKVVSPDGFTRSAVLAGKDVATASFPGPLIQGIKGSMFKLNVIDELTDTEMLRSTSIHWHGLLQEGSNWADGVVSVTQCPISPGHSFLYQFEVPDQAGTFWYHSHYSTQYCDGLRGAFVVYDPLDPHRSRYLIDNKSTIITLADWYHFFAHEATQTTTPTALLVNGKGRYPGGPASPLAVIRVVKGIKYRFRLVSISCDPNYMFSIDGHTMTIIEADGINVQPLNVDSIQIFAGQRYSFVLDANQPIGNYWIRGLPSNGPQGFAGGINSAILRYTLAPNREPTTTQTPSTRPLLETSLVPLSNPGAPGGNAPADVAINLEIGVDATGLKYTMNNVTFDPINSLPVLLQILSKAIPPQALLPKGSIYELPRNKVIEISIPGGSPGSPHPFHLHGHTFDVIRSAGSSSYNYKNPVRRDVVNTGEAGDNVTIRFRTDNPGPWFLHCHIDWHLDVGLGVVFAEDIPSVQTFDPPESWEQLCPIYALQPPEVFP